MAMANPTIALLTAFHFLIQFTLVLSKASSGSNRGLFRTRGPSLFSSINIKRGHRHDHDHHLPAALYDETVPARTNSNILLSLRGGGAIQTITSPSQIQTILDAASYNQLIVLDFTANDCPPCNMTAPIYTDLSQLDEFRNVIFCKVNVSDHPDVAERYGVDGWPTFLLFKGGEVVDSVVGGEAAKAGLYGLVAKHA